MARPSSLAAAAEEPTTGPARILVVDDATDIRLLLSQTLESRGHRVEAVSSGARARERLATAAFDCVLLDLDMPDVHGFELCRELKATEATRSVPVIFLTAYDEPDMVVRGLEVGANDYVTKPLNLRILQARIEVAIRLLRAERREREARRSMEEAYRELAAARSDLQVAHRMTGLTVLAAGLAHELNSPLGALTTNVAFLAEELGRARRGEPLEPDVIADCTEAADESRQSCRRISEVVDRMRLYGEKARARTTNALELRALLEDQCQEIASRFEVRWSVEGPDELWIDAVEIELSEALHAVLENAFVAASLSPTPRVRAGLRAADGAEAVVLTVDDSGEGIPEEDMPFVFDPFFTRKKSWRSVGLGLGIALSIIERYMGRITLEGRGPLGGAQVQVELPRRAPEPVDEVRCLPRALPTLG